MPPTWDSSKDGLLCLLCRRARAAEAAELSLPDGTKIDERAKARRAGLVEFEVRRTPELTDGMIAKACRTSAASVAAARERLQMQAGPPTGSERPWNSAGGAARSVAQKRAAGSGR